MARLAAICAIFTGTAFSQTVVAWGRNDFGQATVPVGLTDVVAISAGGSHNLALRRDGTVVAWGSNQFGQRNVPLALANVTAIAAGGEHSLALQADGTVRCWGWNIAGQCTIPQGLSDVVSISASGNTSAAVKRDGTVVVWGDGSYGQTTLPTSLNDAVSISAGICMVVRRSNGQIALAGGDAYGECSGAPAGLSQVVQVSAGKGGIGGGIAQNQTIVLRSDGTLRAWGSSSLGINAIPPSVAGEKVIEVSAGLRYNLVLTQKGQVLGWGSNDEGQVTIPSGLQERVTAISAGSFHALALKHDTTGSVATETAITLSANPIASTETYTVSYQVTASGSAPTGTVTIREAFGGTCSGPAPSGSCTLTANRLGTQVVTASFQSSGAFTPSRGYAFQRIQYKTETTILNSNPSRSFVGQDYVVNYSVYSPQGPLTGSVTVTDGVTSKSCPVSAGSCTLPGGTAAQRTVIVFYPGDDVFMSSQASITHNVVVSVTSVSTKQFSVDAPAGSVSANVGIVPQTESWSASSNSSWITITPNSGVGPQQISILYSANGNVASRTGIITIGNETITVTQAGITGDVLLAPQSDSIAASGATQRTVTVRANAVDYTWLVTTATSWITLGGNTAVTGNGTVTYDVAPNPSAISRSGAITIGGKQFVITQAGQQPVFSFSSTAQTRSAGVGSGFVTLTVTPSDATWTAASNQPWLTVSPLQGTGPAVLSYAVTANNSVNIRTATVTVGGQSFTVTQEGIVGAVTLNPSADNPPSSGGTDRLLTITANAPDFNWQATTTSPWIAFTTPSTGTGSGSVRYTVAANTSVNSRVGTIQVAGQVMQLTQAGVTPTVTLPKSSENVWSTPGSSNFDVVVTPSDFAWTASTSASWVVLSQTSGVGSMRVTYTYGPNLSRVPRSAMITIGQSVFTVNQAGAPPTSIVLQPSTLSVPMSGAAGRTVSVQSESTTWAATSTVPWITVVGGSPGSGNGTVVIDVAANSLSVPRTGQVQIGGELVTITQEGPTPALTGPISGTGTTNVFTFRFSDAGGFDKLDVVNVLINQYLNGDQACYIAYSQTDQRLYLVKDNGPSSGTSAGLILGQAGSVSNSQCSINGLGSTAVRSGTDLTLSLNVTFSSTFSGSKVIYTAARNRTGGNSGWFTQGSWLVPGEAARFPNSSVVQPVTGVTQRSTLAFQFSDRDSADNLTTAWALINTAIDGRRACYVAYFRPGNLLYLYPDNGDGTQAISIPLSGNNTIENGQCKVYAAGSVVDKSGNNLNVRLDIEFKQPFGGFRGIWTAVQTSSGEVSPWRAVGNWQVP